MGEHVCKGDHKGHLCVLASQDKFDRIKELSDRSEIYLFQLR